MEKEGTESICSFCCERNFMKNIVNTLTAMILFNALPLVVGLGATHALNPRRVF